MNIGAYGIYVENIECVGAVYNVADYFFFRNWGMWMFPTYVFLSGAQQSFFVERLAKIWWQFFFLIRQTDFFYGTFPPSVLGDGIPPGVHSSKQIYIILM